MKITKDDVMNAIRTFLLIGDTKSAFDVAIAAGISPKELTGIFKEVNACISESYGASAE